MMTEELFVVSIIPLLSCRHLFVTCYGYGAFIGTLRAGNVAIMMVLIHPRLYLLVFEQFGRCFQVDNQNYN